jgi:hypothetical protein
VVRAAEPAYPAAVTSLLVPGQRVRHPDRPEWGEGQVQSVVGSRVTVNFEHAGKVLVNVAVVPLEPLGDGPSW